MLRIAAIRHASPSRSSTIVVHIRRVSAPLLISYGPSAMATSGVMKRMVSTVMLRFPGFRADDSIDPRITSARPRRHSPDVVCWSASAVNSASIADASRSSRAST